MTRLLGWVIFGVELVLNVAWNGEYGGFKCL